MLKLAGREGDGAIINWLSADDVTRVAGIVHAAGAGAPKEMVARIGARAVRAATLELRWTLLAYAPMDVTLWGRLGRLYRDCERVGVATLRFKVYADMRAPSTVRREYLRARLADTRR